MQCRWLLLVLGICSAGVHAQWLNYRDPATPRNLDGKANLTAPAPRAPDGKPDLSGVWMHEYTSLEEMRRIYGSHRIDEAIKTDAPGMELATQHKYAFNVFTDLDEESLVLPGTAALMEQRGPEDTTQVCAGVFGFPLAGLFSAPIKIIQAPRVTLILYEADNLRRQVFTDGRRLPKEFDFPAYLGYSTGHRDHDVFVVETAGFNDKTPLDTLLHPHSEALRITERFRRRDFGHLEIETTFNDPKMYRRPFTIKVPYNLLPDSDIFESFCGQNEKDRRHLQK
jgi:hypothetical protein